MRSNIVIDVKNVKPGKSPNWIILESYIGYFDVNRLYNIEFCGTEVTSSIPLMAAETEQLLTMLIKDFGYGPYNISKVKATVGDGKYYVITK